MEIIKFDDTTERDALVQQLSEVVCDGGLVCLPCNGTYRILADFTNLAAVQELMQSKSRTRSAPALLFIDSEDRLDEVADALHPLAYQLAGALWPRPLTIRVQLSSDIPKKIVKQLGGKKAKVGVRMPAGELARALVRAVARPVLVSSANRERKRGESSPAQVRKTFGARVDVFVDCGDLKKDAPSTVVDISDGKPVIVRPGAIEAAELDALLDE